MRQHRRTGLDGLLATALGAVGILAVTAQPVVAAQPNARSMAVISVEFSDDCTMATVESSKDVSNVVAVLTNQAWQKVDDLEESPTYEFVLDSTGSNAGESIRRLYVKSGSFRQKDLLAAVPGFVGIGFDCVPG